MFSLSNKSASPGARATMIAAALFSLVVVIAALFTNGFGAFSSGSAANADTEQGVITTPMRQAPLDNVDNADAMRTQSASNETVKVFIEKQWDDFDNAFDTRPSDISLNFKTIDITLTYDANGGLNAPASETKHVTPATFVVKDQEDMRRSGYQFYGWSMFPNGTAVNYKPSAVMNNVTQNVTLYAVWKPVHTFAVYSEDQSLCFYKRGEIPNVGDVYNGKKVVSVYTGDFEKDAYYDTPGYYNSPVTPWKEVCSTTKTITVVDEIKPRTLSNWFYQFTACTSMDLEKLNVSEVVSLYNTFAYCESLTDLKFSSWNPSNNTYMYNTFNNCKSLKSLDLSKWDTSKVTSMHSAFLSCWDLTTLNLSSFNTGSVTDMGWMFAGCRSMETFDLSSFDTSNVLDMEQMFGSCSGMTHIDLSPLDTSSAISMQGMFNVCTSLTSIDVSVLETTNATDISMMFAHCYKLESINISGWNTEKVENMSSMFFQCYKLVDIDESQLNTGNVQSMAGMFSECNSIKELNLSTFDTSKVTNMDGMFYRCKNLETLNLQGWNTSLVTSMNDWYWHGMFEECETLTSLDLSSFDTSKVTSMIYMFKGCTNLSNLNISSFNTSQVTDMSYMFADCSSITSLNLAHFNTGKVSNMNYMFHYCTSLESLDLSSFNTSNVKSTRWMFASLFKLKTIYVSNLWNVINVSDSYFMFYYCPVLVGGDGTKWDWPAKDKSYAHVDGGTSNPGYLTYKQAPFGAFSSMPKLIDILEAELAPTIAPEQVPLATAPDMSNAASSERDLTTLFTAGTSVATAPSALTTMSDNSSPIKTRVFTISEPYKSSTWVGYVELPARDENGNELQYEFVSEDKIDGYTTTSRSYYDENKVLHCVLVNSLPKAESMISIEWKDKNDYDRIRPATNETLDLKLAYNDPQKRTRSASNTSLIAMGIPANGNEIAFSYPSANEHGSNFDNYTVVGDIPGYTLSLTTSTGPDGKIRPKIIATHVGVVDIPVSKMWQDRNNANKKRPSEVTIELAPYIVKNDYNVEPAGDKQTYTLKKSEALDTSTNNKWNFVVSAPSWDPETEELLQYAVSGEQAVDGYAVVDVSGDMDNGYVITNSETIDVPIEKTWVKDDASKRPNSITLTLSRIMKAQGVISILRDSKLNVVNTDSIFMPIVTTHQVTLTPPSNDAKSARWNGVVEDVPMWDENGELICYDVTENEVPGYAISEVYGSVDTSYSVFNSPSHATMNVTKAWDDSNNAKNIRPDSVNLKVFDKNHPDALTRDAAESDQPPLILLSAENGNNTNGATDPTSARIDAIKAAVSKGEPIYVGANVSLIIAPENASASEWNKTLSNMPIYDSNGNEIDYKVTESPVYGYAIKSVDYDSKTGSLRATNTYTHQTITITKVWDDVGYDDMRPDTIGMTLKPNGNYVDYYYGPGQSEPGKIRDFDATMNKADDGGDLVIDHNGRQWTLTLHDVPVYAQDGTPIDYELVENEVPYGYQPSVVDYSMLHTANTIVTKSLPLERVVVPFTGLDGVSPLVLAGGAVVLVLGYVAAMRRATRPAEGEGGRKKKKKSSKSE